MDPVNRNPTRNRRAPIRIDAHVEIINTAIEPITSHHAMPDESTASRMITVSGT